MLYPAGRLSILVENANTRDRHGHLSVNGLYPRDWEDRIHIGTFFLLRRCSSSIAAGKDHIDCMLRPGRWGRSTPLLSNRTASTWQENRLSSPP